jgi:serine phosphatase RsbU (regulator of sigma subunit)
MSQTRAYLRALLSLDLNAGQLVTRLNDFLIEDSPEDVFVTLFLAQLDPHDREFVYASAGHQCLLLGPGDEMQPLQATGMPLGISPEGVPSAHPRELLPGQMVLFLTDGVTEAMSREGSAFGMERVLDVIRAHRQQSASEIVDALYRDIRRFTSDVPQQDDITAIILRAEAQPQPSRGTRLKSDSPTANTVRLSRPVRHLENHDFHVAWPS